MGELLQPGIQEGFFHGVMSRQCCASSTTSVGSPQIQFADLCAARQSVSASNVSLDLSLHLKYLLECHMWPQAEVVIVVIPFAELVRRFRLFFSCHLIA